MKVLLIAKPWRGGLARYVHTALQALLPGSTQWLPTYPVSMAGKIAYRKDRKAWRQRLVQRVAESDCDAAIFINHVKEFEDLKRDDKFVLWITDDPRPAMGGELPYARTYVADPGYGTEVACALGQDYAGVINFASLPSLHRSHKRVDKRRGFCFIGNKDPKRSPYLRALCANGMDIRAYGNYFPADPLCWRYPGRFRPSVAVERMASIYDRHIASINIHARVVQGGTNMRTYECASYQIAQIVECLPGLELLFEPEKDLLTFDSEEQLLEQIARLQQDPQLASALASSAIQRVRREHTYFHRVKQLLEGLVDIPINDVVRLATL